MLRGRYLLLFWLLFTIIATGIGLVAVNIVGEQIKDQWTGDLFGRDDGGLRRLPAAPVPRPEQPRPVPLVSAGGTTTAMCRGSQVFLQSWSPAAGWTVSEIERGPGVRGRLVYTNGTSRNEVLLRCRDGQVVMETSAGPIPTAAPASTEQRTPEETAPPRTSGAASNRNRASPGVGQPASVVGPGQDGVSGGGEEGGFDGEEGDSEEGDSEEGDSEEGDGEEGDGEEGDGEEGDGDG